MLELGESQPNLSIADAEVHPTLNRRWVVRKLRQDLNKKIVEKLLTLKLKNWKVAENHLLLFGEGVGGE